MRPAGYAPHVEGLRSLAALVMQPLVVASLDGEVLLANDAARESLGLEAGSDLADALATGEDPREQLRACARHSGVVPWRWRPRSPAGHDTTAALATRIEVDGAPAVAILLRDEDQVPFAQVNDRLRRLQREVRYRAAAERQRDAALVAERSARRRLVRLQHLTGHLSRAAGIDAVTDVVLSTGVDELGAAEAWVCLLDEAGTTFEVVGYVGAEEQAIERWRRFAREPGLPATDALARREPVAWQSAADRDRQYPAMRGNPAAHEAYVVAPMNVGRTEVGALVFGFPEPRAVDADDREFVQAAADQTAQAVMRARLHENERRAHRHQRFLAEAGMLLARSLRHEDVLAEVAALSVPTLAEGCAVHLATDDGLRPVAAAHADPERRDQLDRLLDRGALRRNPYIREVARSGRSLLLPALPQGVEGGTDGDEAHRALVERLGVTSGLVVALTARGRTLGTLTLLASGRGRQLGEQELAVAEDLAAHAGLAIDNARLYAERAEVARVLQQSLLPPELPCIPGVRLAARHQPATELLVGGDFYDVFEGRDGSWTLLIGDVCGKDAAAASLTGLARHTARAVTVRDAGPREVLAVMNESFGRYESSEMFCTAVCVRLRPQPSGVAVEAVVAGHPPPVLLKADGSVGTLAPGGQPVGLFPDIDLAVERFVLGTGDALVLYTDGVTEARQGAGLFGEEGLLEALGAHGPGTADAVADHLLATIDRYQGQERGDDTAVVVITPDPPSASHA